MRWTPLAVALLVQAALLLWRLDRLPVWGDEQFTLDVIALPWGEVAAALRRDIHPPLYFALAKLWAALPLAGTEIVRLRAFSAFTMFGATVALDRLALAGRDETVRRWTLAAWAISPAAVLYGRMARSYALQTLLAVLALYAAMRLIEKPTRLKAIVAGIALAALLYTHYLPGLAVAGALAVAGVSSGRLKAAATAAGVAGLLYLPWAIVLAEGLARAADKTAYAITGSWLAELPVRAGYALLGLFAGEAHNTATFGFGAALSVGLFVACVRGWRDGAAAERLMLGAAALIGFFGAAKWVSFPFMPARLLWLLPWALALAVTGAPRWPKPRFALGAWLALLAAGQVFYVRQDGFLNKGYLAPYAAIAREIRQSGAADDLVLADATNGDPSPLRAALAGGRFRRIENEADVAPAIDAALEGAGSIWHVRAARDVSPNLIQDEVDRRLEDAGFRKSVKPLLPYSTLDRLLLRAMGDPDPPRHYLLLLELERPPAPTAP
jgi:hypothetical protein